MAKTAPKTTNKINKNEFLLIFAFSIVCVFSFFVFNQFDIMLNNPGEFGVSISEVLFAYIIRCFVIFVAFIMFLTFLCWWSKKVFKYTVATILGIILATYFQTLFLNEDEVMTLNGTIQYADAWDYILNTLIFVFVASIPVVFLIIKSKTATEQNSIPNKQLYRLRKLVLTVSLVVLGMQTIGLSSVAATAPKISKTDSLYYFSVDEQLRLSENENIIVFIVDRLDTLYTNEVFENNPEYEEIFSGFTYYTNNLSEYPGTFPSVLSMLSGKQFDKQTKSQIDYTREAWNEEVLFDALREKDFIVNGLPNGRATYYDFDDLYFNDGVSKFNNIKKLEKENRIINQGRFFETITAMASTRQSPYVLKSAFTTTSATRKSDPINYYIDVVDTPDYFPNWNSSSTDLLFYEKLKNEGLSAKEEKNVLSFVHLHGSHDPNIYDEELIARNYRTTAVAQTRGAFKILEEYFEQMKALEKFDDATIIIMADHGNLDEEGRITGITNPPLSSLFIKESGKSDDSSLKKDHDSQLSHNNFQATILEAIGAYDVKENLDGDTAFSYFDIINCGGIPKDGTERQAGVQTRHFYLVRWTNLTSCTYICAYEVTGNANKIENWIKL